MAGVFTGWAHLPKPKIATGLLAECSPQLFLVYSQVTVL